MNYWRRLPSIVIVAATISLLVASSCPVLAQENDDLGLAQLDRTMRVTASGQVYVDDRPSRQVEWDILPDRHVLRYKVVDQSPVLFGGSTLAISLPVTVKMADVRPQIFAVHGVENAEIEIVDDSNLMVKTGIIEPGASLTVTIDFPPTAIHFSSWQRIAVWLGQLTLTQWLIIALIIPALLLSYILWVVIRYWADIFLKPAPIVQATPPSTLPPAMVGVLVHGYVGEREIAATLIDLARRGVIDIIYKGENDFGFSQKRPWQQDPTVLPYEKAVLQQIFTATGVISTSQQIKQELNAHIWSESITTAIESIYSTMTELGYFKESPKHFHLPMRFIGMVTFFLSVIGLGISLYFFSEQLFITIPWVVGLLLSPLVNRVALLGSRRTPAGRQQATLWLAFRDYLAQPEPVRFAEEVERYEQFLSLAIVLRVEDRWTARYAALPCRVPGWFYTQGMAISSFGQLAALLFSVIGFVSQKFSFSRKPSTI